MVEAIFIQLALILGVAFLVSYIVRSFGQPLIIGYIIAGMIISPFILKLGASQEIISIFSDIGIAFLLFIVGIHLNPKVIKEIGFSSMMIGIGQMALTFVITFFVSVYVLGFSGLVSIYVALALSFSSTIISMKILSDKKQLDSLHGKIATGVLITQDLVAILALIIISSVANGASDLGSFALKGFLSGGALVVFTFLIGFLILPRITKHIAKTQELLFLFSICWCFVVSALFSYFGFTIEIGALIAGIALSVSPYSTEISSRIRPLRDFFLIIFFIILGLNIPLSSVVGVLSSALILSVIALILKPMILMALSGFYNYTKRTNFLVGTTLGQISEFSLIVIALGASYYSAIGAEVISTVVLTLVLTIIFSTYMITYSNELYKKLHWFARFFEGKKPKKDKKKIKNYDSILFGYNRIGFSILSSLKKIKKNYLVVDFNPDTINNLSKIGVPCVYGDVYDADFLEELPIDKMKIAVSTIPDFDTNKILIETIRIMNPKAIIVVRAHAIEDALELYKEGANYVLTPHFLGGEYVADMIHSFGMSERGYEKEKKDHIRMLEERLKMNQRHPEVERG